MSKTNNNQLNMRDWCAQKKGKKERRRKKGCVCVGGGGGGGWRGRVGKKEKKGVGEV